MINLLLAIPVGLLVRFLITPEPIFMLFSMWLTLLYLEILDIRQELKEIREEL